MRVEVKSKNYKSSDSVVALFEKKFAKLDKYFPEEITAQVHSMKEKDHFKTEATIRAQKHIFRAEVITQEPNEAVDKLVEKLSNQMSKFKTKLQKKYKDHKGYDFAELPEIPDEKIEPEITKKKTFELEVMTAEEAVVHMEQLSHQFYVFMNEETDKVCVVYVRKDGEYGLLETTY